MDFKAANRRHRPNSLCLTLLTLAMAFSPLQALASSDLMQGMGAYNANDFATAKSYFQRALQSAPEDSLAHYYLGNTLLKLKDPAGAKKEYQKGSDSAETDDVKDNCTTAIQALQKNDKTKPVQPGTALGAAGVGAAAGISAAAGADGVTGAAGATAGAIPGQTGIGKDGLITGGVQKNEAASLIPGLIPPPGSFTLPGFPGIPGLNGSDTKAGAVGLPGGIDPEIKLSPLQKQAEAQKEYLKQQTEAAQKALLENAQNHAKSIDSETKRATDMTDWNARARGRAAAYMEQLKTQGAQQATQVLNRAKSQASEIQKMQEAKAKAIDDVANNLNDQMNSQVGHSSVHLKPEGTSIYVRNYGP